MAAELTGNPAITAATFPFNKTAADAILRTSDYVDFWVRRSILAEASCIFEDMLSIPQPPPGSPNSDEVKDGLPIIPLAEESVVLDRLLRLCYPVDDPKLNSLEELRPVLEAATKYMMTEATTLLSRRLVQLGQLQPLRAFAIACVLDMTREAEALLPLAHRVHGSFVEELHDISASTYYRVVHYQPRGEGRNQRRKQGEQRQSPTTSMPRSSPKSTTQNRDSAENATDSIPREFLDSPMADVVLRSSDGVEFSLHSVVLAFASPVFQRMIADQKALEESARGPISVPEDSRTLTTLLRHVYPLARPAPPHTFRGMKALLIAAHKYAFNSAISALRPALLKFLPDATGEISLQGDNDPLRVFALAHQLGFAEERAAAARSLLRLPAADLRQRYVEELEEISAAAYFRLLKYHGSCGMAASAYILDHTLAYCGAARPASAPAPSPPPSSGGRSWYLKKAEGDALASSLDATELVRILSSKRGHQTCHVLLDETSDPAWTHFRNVSAPRWWIMYVYKISIIMRTRPWGRVALDQGLRRQAIERSLECDLCREHFVPGFQEYAEGLAKGIQKVVENVKLEL